MAQATQGSSTLPRGPEREVRFLGASSIGGARVSYVVVLGAVVAVLSFIPFSIALSAGSSFPMAQGVYPLTGLLLGPWGGAAASALGSLVGVFLAPHTAGLPWLTVAGSALGAVAAGCLVSRGRARLSAGVSALILAEIFLFQAHAVGVNGVSASIFANAYAAHFLAIATFMLPTRGVVASLIESADLRKVWLGLFIGTWCASSIMMLSESFVSYYLFNWPEALFRLFMGLIPFEQAARSGIGAVIGTGVIAGLRGISLLGRSGGVRLP